MHDERTDPGDSHLITLGQELASIPNVLEQTDEHDAAIALLDRLETLSNELAATPARTIEGLQAKARATGWALEENFNPAKETTLNGRIVASIVKDLLMLSGRSA